MENKQIVDEQTARYLVELGRKIGASDAEPIIREECGRKFVFKDGVIHREIEPPTPIQPITTECYTLSGLSEFVRRDVDGAIRGSEKPYMVRVADQSMVEVLSPANEVNGARNVLAFSRFCALPLCFGKYMPAEDMNVSLQANFVASGDRDAVLSIAGSIRDQETMDTADDGFSQKVTVAKGVATKGNVIVRNPVRLTPYRTFPEIEQVESPFVFRVQEGAKLALFEADGGAWKVEAVTRIGAWLKVQLEGCNVVVIA